MKLFRTLSSPGGLLVLFVGLITALLVMPVRLPLGSNYWDLYLYVDSAYRISQGQIPHVDYFSPVGPLEFYLYYLVNHLFPTAHTVLSVHYSILVLAVPIMIVIVFVTKGRSRFERISLVVPFILFGLLPINGMELYPFPGFDGFGAYNRHVSLLLYLLSVTILFTDKPRLAGMLAVILICAMLLIKITGAVVGIALLLHAICVRRISIRSSALTAVALLFILGCIEWRTGLILAYVDDVVELISMNVSFLQPRLWMVMAVKTDVILSALLLTAWLLLKNGSSIARDISTGRWRDVLDSSPVWLLSLLLGGVLYETQNTGSHELIIIWPAIVLAFRTIPLHLNRSTAFFLLLIALTVLPTPVSMLHRSLRAIAVMPIYEPLQLSLLGPTGRVSARANVVRHAQEKMNHYHRSQESYRLLAAQSTLPSEILVSETDFQVTWMLAIQEAAEAVIKYEQDHGVYFERIMTMDFVDPIPAVLNRTPVKGISIGNDPTRTIMTIDSSVVHEVSLADAYLMPLCPITYTRQSIEAAYVHDQRLRIPLTNCYDMLVRTRDFGGGPSVDNSQD